MKEGKENLIKKRPSTTKLDLVISNSFIGKNIPVKHRTHRSLQKALMRKWPAQARAS
jgi:hypothetical protein